MGARIRMGALINKNTFERGAYWKEGAKSNHYGSNKKARFLDTCIFFRYSNNCLGSLSLKHV